MGLVVAEVFCWSGFAFELDRAVSGNTLSWAYVFEWPIFAGYAVYMWRRLSREESGTKGPPPAARTPEPPDQSLARYNEYLREVHERNDSRKGPLETPFNG